MSSGKKTREKRSLVRWNDDLDKQLLLTTQYACNEAGLRIPWDHVAELMGDNFSKGAIEQHLSKIRGKMKGLDLKIPPPLRRGSTQTPSRVYAASTSTPKRQTGSRSSGTPASKTSARRAARRTAAASPPTGRKGKKRARKSSDSESELSEIFDGGTDDDDDYGSSNRKKVKGNIQPKKEMTEESIENGPGLELPTRNTRGARKSYTQYGLNSDDEDDFVKEEGDDASTPIASQDTGLNTMNQYLPDDVSGEAPPSKNVANEDFNAPTVNLGISTGSMADLGMTSQEFKFQMANAGYAVPAPVSAPSGLTDPFNGPGNMDPLGYGAEMFMDATWYNDDLPMLGGNNVGNDQGDIQAETEKVPED